MLEAFRRGEFDQIEIIGQADEKAFFELCFKEKLLEALAQQMPTARKKEEVPPGFILAALAPGIASKHLDPKTQRILLECRGFNGKNHYSRRTPCDQDTLRKYVKDVPAPQWLGWHNGPVQQVYQSYGFFDPSGIFIGDGSYLFVPDNPAYEGSVVMWFDEPNHPVEYDKLSPEERKKAHRERCYKLVNLLHLRGNGRVYAGLALLPGNAHECPVLYQLVGNFVKHVGQGVIKLLILDRGFIDGANIARCKREWGIDVLLRDAYADGHQDQWALMTTADFANPRQPKDQYERRPQVEEGHRLLKCFYDLAQFHSQDFDVIAPQVVFILLSYTLRQWQLWKSAQEELAGKTPGLLRRQLNLYNEYIVIYHEHAYAPMPLVSFSRELLELGPEARAKALVKPRKLEQSLLTPLEHSRAPP